MSIITPRCRTSEPSKLNSRLTYLVAVKATSTGRKCLQLADYMNGSALQTLSELLQVTTFMIILVNNNLGAPSFWAMGRSHLLSLLLDLTPLVWDAGLVLLFQARLASLLGLLVLTILANPPLIKPTVSGHSTAPISSVRMTPVSPEWPSCMTLALLSQLGKQQETTSSSWLT